MHLFLLTCSGGGTVGGMDGWVDGWMDGSVDGWMDRWMDGWRDGSPPCVEEWVESRYTCTQ